jgi:hypothetical protein
MVQVKSLNCPNCGGSMPDTSKACSFCGSRVILSNNRQNFVLAGTICPKCGVNNKGHDRFCSNCGDKLFKQCLNCHKEIGLDSLHCSFCGTNIDNSLKKKEEALARRKDSIRQRDSLRHAAKELSSQGQSLEQPGFGMLHDVPGAEDISGSISTSGVLYALFGACIMWSLVLSLILFAIFYFIGFEISFMLNFVVIYVIVIMLGVVRPRQNLKRYYNKCRRLSNKKKELQKQIERHDAIIHQVNSMYGGG